MNFVIDFRFYAPAIASGVYHFEVMSELVQKS